jgi:predicted RND superfamily exporter protein
MTFIPFAEQRTLHWIVTYRRPLFFSALIVTLFFASGMGSLKIDDRFDALIDTRAPTYRQYLTYLDRFGSDRMVIAAVTCEQPADSPQVLSALKRTAERLRQIPDVVEVTTLLDMASVQKSTSGIIARSVVALDAAEPRLDHALLEMLRTTWPAIRQFISQDGRTTGLLIRLTPIDQQQQRTTILIQQFTSVIAQAFAPMPIDLHTSGGPIFVEAVSRYNVTNAWRFLLFSGLIGILVQLYIFKNLVISLFICGISAAATVWGMGLMAYMGISLNPVSSMAFGMILILTAMSVIHLVSHYYDHYAKMPNREMALQGALEVVVRPSLLCALTTAVGFISIVITPVPAVRQFGLIMALGAMLSFALVYLMLPFLLLHAPGAIPKNIAARSGDLLECVQMRLGRMVIRHPGRVVLSGIVLLALLLAGIPRIQVDTLFLSLFHPHAPEVVSYHHIRERLADPDTINVIVEPDPQKTLNTQALLKIHAFESQLLDLANVRASHSFFRVLETVYAGISGSDDGALYTSPFVFQQLYRLCLQHPESRRLFSGSLDVDSRSFCFSLWVDEQSQTDLVRLLAGIDALAAENLSDVGRVWVTGASAVAHAQSKRLIGAQIQSLSIALVLIVLLLMLQFKSWQLGILSLIPNVFPLAALFGAMGWLGIALDNMTIMVAVISFGLSVDDTVHYLSHLKTGLGPDPRLETVPLALTHAYRLTAKALISTSAVMVFAFLTLIFSPFKPTASFGLLAAVTAAVALASDILFLPALVLWSTRLKKVLVTL